MLSNFNFTKFIEFTTDERHYVRLKGTEDILECLRYDPDTEELQSIDAFTDKGANQYIKQQIELYAKENGEYTLTRDEGTYVCNQDTDFELIFIPDEDEEPEQLEETFTGNLTAFDLLKEDPKFDGEPVDILDNSKGHFMLGKFGNIYDWSTDTVYTQVEQWKEIKDYPDYQVSTFGRVRSKRQNKKKEVWKILKPGKNSDGYLQVVITNSEGARTYKVHRLVGEAFIPNPDNLPEINHRDEDKTNCCVWNLEWCTREYNINYGTRNKRVSEAMAIPVVSVDLETGDITEYKSVTQAGEDNGLQATHIVRACKGKYSKKGHNCGGFAWYYKEDFDKQLEENENFWREQGILDCCEGRIKTFLGYGWRFKQEDPDQDQEDDQQED